MKTVPLPKQLDLRGLAARGAEVAGTVSSEDLPRLSSAGVRLAELAHVALRLSKDEAGRGFAMSALFARYDLAACHLHADGLCMEGRGGRYAAD